MHGAKRQSRPTEFGLQLREKQKAKKVYGILERQFRNYFDKARRQKGDTGEIMRQLLELRFDNAVFKSGLSQSRRQARQLINHGQFLVNRKKVNIASYQLKPKDEISIKPQKAGHKIFTDLEKKLEKKQMPGWLKFDLKNQTIKILNRPAGGEMEQTYNPRLIVEFYSK